MSIVGILVALLVGLGVLVATIALVIKNLLYVCQPNEVLVFSGRPRRSSMGVLHYRTIKGGWGVRRPIIEAVDSVDLTNMIIDIEVRNAYSKGGIPLTVQGVANLKVPGELPLLHNALERFLGRSREEIMKVARETLEGNLRGVLATLTPEQVNEDKEAFAHKLTDEAEQDLTRIGLVLDTLKIQNVSDDVGYLDAIGRMRSAKIRRDAQVAEAEAKAAAAEVKWDNHKQGELAKLRAAIEIAKEENHRRVADARTKRAAMIMEQRAAVLAAIAQARAELDMQDARIEQVRHQLVADVVQPAHANTQQAVAKAKAHAVGIVEQGKATSQVLKDLAKTYRRSGDSGRDVLLMQKLIPVLEQVAGTIGRLRVDRLTVISPTASGADGGSLAGQLVKTGEEIKAATGIDVAGVLRDKLGTGQPT